MKGKKRRKSKERDVALQLRLYIADTTARSMLAKANLQSFCDRYLRRGYKLRIIDIVREPEAAFRDDILATPTLVRVVPGPPRAIVGNLSDTAAVLRALDLSESEARPEAPGAFLGKAGTA